MRFKTRKYSKKTIITVASITLVLIFGGAGAMYYFINDSPQKAPTTSTERQTSIPDSTDGAATSGKDSSNDGKSSSDNGSSTNTIDSIESPAIDSAYPIENQHYKIMKIDSLTYEVTLYAISNSPSQYEDYTAQLTQFKKEVIDYLKERYGDISKFTIYWSPPSVENL